MQKTEEPKDKNINLISMHDEMSSSYLSYAMSVIVSRALPDIRDGLKPVHRIEHKRLSLTLQEQMMQ